MRMTAAIENGSEFLVNRNNPAKGLPKEKVKLTDGAIISIADENRPQGFRADTSDMHAPGKEVI